VVITVTETGLCSSLVCPEGRIWGRCTEAAHWEARNGVSTTRVPMTTAHRLSKASYNLAHVITHLHAAMHPKSPTDQKFNLEHVDKHVGIVRDNLERLVEHIREHYPAEAKALDDLDDANPEPEQAGA